MKNIRDRYQKFKILNTESFVKQFKGQVMTV